MSHTIYTYVATIKKLLCIEEAARHGSIKAAAAENGFQQSNMSILIRNFEKEINQKLLVRLSNGVQLTEAGYNYYQTACEIKALVQKLDALPQTSIELKGSIRLWISDGLGLGFISK